MGISRREMLAAANMRKEEPSVAGESIIDDIITRTEKNSEDTAGAGKEKPVEEPVPALRKTEDAGAAPKKKRPGRPRKNPEPEPQPAAEPAGNDYGDRTDIFARLQRKAQAEKKSMRMSVAVYPSTEAYLRKTAEEIGCSVNDLINEILINWKETRES